MIGRNATRIDLKLDDDLKELDEEHMTKLRQQKKFKADLDHQRYEESQRQQDP